MVFSLIKRALAEERKKYFTSAYNLLLKAEEHVLSDPTRVRLMYKRAGYMEQVGNNEEAHLIIKSIINKFSNTPEGFLFPSMYYNKLKNFKLSRNLLRMGIDQFPDNSDLYLTLAYFLKETERWNESIDILKKALSRENLQRAKNGIDRADIWNELGHLYFERGNYNSCIASLKKAISKKGNLVGCYGTIARSYLYVGDPLNAIKYLNEQWDFYNFWDSDDYIIKARAHARLKEYEQAEHSLESAYEDVGMLLLSSEDMVDFSELTKKGFFLNFENVEITD